VPAEEPRAVDDVGASLTDELDQHRKFFRGVLEIGVLNDDEIAPHRLEAAAQRGALAHVARLKEQRESPFALQALKRLKRAIRGAIVDDHELNAQRDRQHPRDDLFDGLRLVEGGHHHREQRVLEDPAEPRHQPAATRKP
jgi:hypothetical protein